ncbi:MAG TPA: serine/threonine-protein kinase [Terriglobales bacterium]|nr:serine/threonine-protein kinase [Terriglobales bacterium]
MKTDRWQQVRAVLDEAIAMPAEKRAAYLDNKCARDVELRSEVDSLLCSHEQAGDEFLNSPAIDLKSFVPNPHQKPAHVGRRIGVYQIKEQIGHGGMGEVYRAVRADGQYDKQVAIKLVRIGLDTPYLVERFRHERQILASLDHPNIARLHDGGTTEDGIPYLVMELLEGTPIDQYCEQNNLGITERLQLFMEVCAAVQYAHQRLVIHRDIKPSNVLVSKEGIPKLLDFGIAKIVDPMGGTETTMVRPMTPEYASPEQIRGEPITTAADVYSLGVVLYKLLTGKSPYPESTRTPHEFARLICEAEPARPSTVIVRSTSANTAKLEAPARLNRRLAVDIDNIVLKALRKEPERRYATAAQLAEDIRRHLRGLPVTAVPDSLLYRAKKFLHRHQIGVAATVLVLVALAGGVIATVREARIAEVNRRRAEARFNDVRKLANSFLFEFDEAIRNLPGSTPARSLVVKRALEYLDGLATEARGDRSLQLEIASAYQKVAEVQGNPIFPNLGDSKGALESSRKSQTTLESLLREDPENQQARLWLAGNHQQISDVLSFSGDTAGAVENSGNALRMYEGLAGTLAADPKFQAQRVSQTYHYANLLRSVGRLDEAESEYRKAIALSQQMIDARPSEQEGKVHLATSFDGLGYVLQEKGDTENALENRRKGLIIREELTKLDPNNAHYGRQLAFSHHNVGLSLVEAGDLISALANFRQELGLFESLSTPDPKNVQARRNRSLAHKQIGDVLMRTQDFHGALVQYRAALDIDRDLTTVDPSNSQAVLDLSFSESKVGAALGKLGHPQEGLTMLRSGIAKQESLLAKDPHHILLHTELASSYSLLANCLLDTGDTKGAIEYYRKSVAARLAYSQKSPNSSMNRGALAECYSNLGKALTPNEKGEALKQYNNAIELLEPLTRSDRNNARNRITLADALLNTARIYERMAGQTGEPEERLQYWTDARSLYQRSQMLWMELDKARKLPPAGSHTVQEVNGELAHSSESLVKLQQAH